MFLQSVEFCTFAHRGNVMGAPVLFFRWVKDPQPPPKKMTFTFVMAFGLSSDSVKDVSR